MWFYNLGVEAEGFEAVIYSYPVHVCVYILPFLIGKEITISDAL